MNSEYLKMINLIELNQFVRFAELGTLSKAAEMLYISQPTLTRSMKHIEDEFNVSLFNRSRNRLDLNETGKKAAEYAKRLLEEEKNMIESVQAFDRSLNTIRISSCAPAPLWTLIPEIYESCHGMMISSSLDDAESIIRDVESEKIDAGVIPYRIEDSELACIPYSRETLYACIPISHPLSSASELSFDDLNGYNAIIRNQIGFWDKMCRERMPASRFLVQNDDFAFRELVRSSTLLSFATNLAADGYKDILSERHLIRISDKEADVRYYIITKKKAEEIMCRCAEKHIN